MWLCLKRMGVSIGGLFFSMYMWLAEVQMLVLRAEEGQSVESFFILIVEVIENND